jgi:DNA-binding response OmpR family regulator
MRILVAGDDESERRRIATVLQEAGHRVHLGATERAVLEIHRQDPVQLVLLTLEVLSPETVELLRALGASGSATPHVLSVAGRAPEPLLTAAYRIGLDGEVPKTSSIEYLLARTDSIERRVDPNAYKKRTASAAQKANGVQRITSTAVSSDSGRTPLELVATSLTWRGAREKLKGAASAFLTLAATTTELPASERAFEFGCSIVLINVEQELELRIALGVDQTSARDLAIHLFGAEGEDLAGDMLGELANILMGAMKTAFSAESLAFTGGLPETATPDVILRPTTTYKLQDAFVIALQDARVIVHLGLRSKGNLLIVPAALREGMVLSKDVLNARGTLLVNGGTRLSLNMIDKLRGMLPSKHTVEVMA